VNHSDLTLLTRSFKSAAPQRLTQYELCVAVSERITPRVAVQANANLTRQTGARLDIRLATSRLVAKVRTRREKMSETAPDTLDGANADAPIEAQGTCEKPISPNCECTALYTVILPDDAMTVLCCEPCKDEHVKRANAQGVPVTVRAGTRIEAGLMAPRWLQRVRERIASWSGRQRQWLALVIVVLLLLIAAGVVFLRLAFS